jgi:hypothetical protein
MSSRSLLVRGRDISLQNSSLDSGGENSGGRIRVEAENLTLTSSRIGTDNRGSTSSKNGPIEIIATNLTMTGSSVSASTSGNLFGNEGGDINVKASNIAMIDSSIDTSGRAFGAAGDIDISANIVTVGKNSGITATTSSFVEGPQGGSIIIRADTLNLLDGGAVKAEATTSSLGGGTRSSDAGLITANVGTLTMTNGATISSTNTGSTPGTNASTNLPGTKIGKAGTITIQGVNGQSSQANSVSLTQSSITTEAAGGAGGVINLAANQLNVLDSAISATSKSATTIQPPANVQVRGGNFAMSGGVIAAETGGAATGGNIDINVGNMAFKNGATLTTSSTSTAPTAGKAGDITLTSGIDIHMVASTISTTADQVSGGNIKLTAPNIVRLVRSTVTSSVQGEAGSNGGNINIDPQVVVIQSSNLTANANAGAGGNINISALGAVLVDPNSVLSATAGPAGVSGTVNISSPVQVLSGALVPMKVAYTQSGLSGDRCAADPKGQFSSFVQTGRDGAPETPGGLALSPIGFLDSLQTSFLNTDQSITQRARFGLTDAFGENANVMRFVSACRS